MGRKWASEARLATETDGYRVLVDRVWPRGKKKEELKIDRWLKSIAPSDGLRKWFNHDPARWTQFKEAYFVEPTSKEELRELRADPGWR